MVARHNLFMVTKAVYTVMINAVAHVPLRSILIIGLGWLVLQYAGDWLVSDGCWPLVTCCP